VLTSGLHETAHSSWGSDIFDSSSRRPRNTQWGVVWRRERVDHRVLLEILDKHYALKTVGLNLHGSRCLKFFSPPKPQLYRCLDLLLFLSGKQKSPLNQRHSTPCTPYRRRFLGLLGLPVDCQICGSECVKRRKLGPTIVHSNLSHGTKEQ
jgi:hypothetical protein